MQAKEKAQELIKSIQDTISLNRGNDSLVGQLVYDIANEVLHVAEMNKLESYVQFWEEVKRETPPLKKACIYAYTREELAKLVADFLEQASFIDENKLSGGRHIAFRMEFDAWMQRREEKVK